MKIPHSDERAQSKFEGLAYPGKIILDDNGVGGARKINRFDHINLVEFVVEVHSDVPAESFQVSIALGDKLVVEFECGQLDDASLVYQHFEAVFKGHYPFYGRIE